MSPQQPFDGSAAPTNTIMVAVDKDKNSGHAFRWATNHFDKPIIIAVHVKHKNIPHQGTNVLPPDEEEVAHVFRPLRGMCHSNIIKMKEAVLDNGDVVRGILDYAQRNHIHNIVVGASTRNSLARSLNIKAGTNMVVGASSKNALGSWSLNIRTGTKKFKSTDVPAAIVKSAPDFSSVYVISKGKIVAARAAMQPSAHMAIPTKQPLVLALTPSELENGVRTQPPRRGDTNEELERNSPGSSNSAVRTPVLERVRSSAPSQSGDNIHKSNSTDSLSDESDIPGPLKFVPTDVTKQDLDLSLVSDSSCSSSDSSREMEAEMRRLRLKLKQTMDMYSSACKKAISAQNQAKEINQWKLEEERKYEEFRLAEEAALAVAEQEKARAKAAMEAAKEAKKLAEMEAQRRKRAEMKALLGQNDFLYRKYTIDDIEIATEKFSQSLKIGEGGYGPVYKGQIDHTPVAIKILAPDASQGRKQFQQEVEVLSSIRHPNMVLLLGACPEYGCLVYEHMENGSLDDRLFRKNNNPPIPWDKRFEIASEIATALLFLHQSKPEPLVHRDLKPANILLDRNFVSKISDVGLARLVPPSVADSVTQYYMTSAAGTFCYIDPEYQQTGMLTTKSDIYSLGIMLLQIITAKPPMGLSHQVKKAIEKGIFSKMLDPAVTDWPVEEALAFAKLALSCAELSKKDRPDLASVILPELSRLRDLGYTLHSHQFICSNSPSHSQAICSPTTPRDPHSEE